MSLKSLADEVLERNRGRNSSATEPEKVAQLQVVQRPPVVAHKPGERWDPDLAVRGYVWCLDCQHFDTACTHPDNPFRQQQPLAPRKCQWYSESLRRRPISSENGP